MKKSKAKKNSDFIWGIIMAIIIAIAAIAIAPIISDANVPQEYKNALASLQQYNQNGCSLLDQTIKAEYYAKSKIEECFAQDNYSNEAKQYAWKKANIDFEGKAIRLIQDFIESQGHIMEKHTGNSDTSYEAVKKALRMNQEMFKSAWIENYGYTEEQIDNAFKKVLEQ